MHGIRDKSSTWMAILCMENDPATPTDVINSIKKVKASTILVDDDARFRSFLRICLNIQKLSTVVFLLISKADVLDSHYKDNALIRNADTSKIM